jgi:hypothetical protein
MTTYLANVIELSARIKFEQLEPSVACWRSGRYSCSVLIAVEAAGRWLLLLGDPKK